MESTLIGITSKMVLIYIYIYLYIYIYIFMLNFRAVHIAHFIALRFRLAIKDHTPEAPGCFRSFWGASRVLESLPFGFRREKEMKKRPLLSKVHQKPLVSACWKR